MTDATPDDPTLVQPAAPGLYPPAPAETADAAETVAIPAPEESPTEGLQPAAPLPPESGDSAAKPRRLWPIGLAASLLVLLGAGYVAGYVMSGDLVPRNATAGGVAIGGLGRDAAVAKLTAELGPRALAPITVEVEGKSGTIRPDDAGLVLDPAATVEASGVGRSWSPSHIVRVLVGGGAVDPVVKSDPTKLYAAVTDYAKALDAEPVDATVAFQGIVPAVKPAKSGLKVDVSATAEAVRATYLTTSPVIGKGTAAEPQVATAQAQQVLESYAKPAVSGPITLDLGKGTVVVTPEQIAAATSFPVTNGTIAGATDVKVLYAAAGPAINGLGLEVAKDATITIGANGPVITPSVDGVTLSEDEFGKAVSALVTTIGDRTAKPALAAQKPAFTTEAAQGLGIKEVTGEFTTYFPYAAYRNNNLGQAAKGINNTLLKPGDIFSLNNALGERTAANGYVEGYVIVGGALVKELGGGVSQSATTTFNAMFFAGLKDIEHTPHMFFIDRYPPGREATVYWGSLDLRFQNDTQYGALMQAFITPATASTNGSITVRVWSTKTFDKVESSELRKSNFTQPSTRTSSGPKCEPQSPNQGFDVNYERLFYKGGQLVRTEKFFWRYQPEDRIVCA